MCVNSVALLLKLSTDDNVFWSGVNGFPLDLLPFTRIPEVPRKRTRHGNSSVRLLLIDRSCLGLKLFETIGKLSIGIRSLEVQERILS